VRTAIQEGVAKLYHYQASQLEYLKDTLSNNRVHLSNPQNVNDPWDCQPCFDTSIVDPVCRRKWGQILGPTFEQLPSEVRSLLVPSSGENWYDNLDLLTQAIEVMAPSVRALNVERWRMYCLTPHPDSLLMWAHYAEKHKGVCLEFDAKQIGNSYRVLYPDLLQAIGPDTLNDPKALLDAVLLSKSSEWAYENEYRILARDKNADPGFLATTDEDFLDLLPGALTGIIVGCNADIQAIRSAVQDCAPHLPMKQAVKAPHKYHLEIVEFSK
jgi:hypothetical protein